jgi:hypothetical protein
MPRTLAAACQHNAPPLPLTAVRWSPVNAECGKGQERHPRHQGLLAPITFPRLCPAIALRPGCLQEGTVYSSENNECIPQGERKHYCPPAPSISAGQQASTSRRPVAALMCVPLKMTDGTGIYMGALQAASVWVP